MTKQQRSPVELEKRYSKIGIPAVESAARYSGKTVDARQSREAKTHDGTERAKRRKARKHATK